MRIKRKLLFWVILWCGLTACSKPAEKEALPTVLVQVTQAKQISIAPTLTVYGTASFPPEKAQQLTVKTEQRVLKIWVSIGQTVKKGDPLIEVSPTANAELNLESAKIAVDFSKKELARLLQLKTQYLATNAEVQAAQQNLDKAQLTLNNLITQQQPQILHAEMDSTIIGINVQAGQIVQPGSGILTFAQNGYLQVRLGVEAEDIIKIKIGQMVSITPVYGDIPEYKTVIQQITGQVNPGTNLVEVIVVLANAPGLPSGSIVRGEIFLQAPTQQIAVPHNAVLYDNQKKPYLFVVNAGKAKQRWVKIGEDNGEWITILEGLSTGEQVVVLGNYELTDGENIRIEEEKP